MLKTTSLTRPIAKVTHVSVAQMKLHFHNSTFSLFIVSNRQALRWYIPHVSKSDRTEYQLQIHNWPEDPSGPQLEQHRHFGWGQHARWRRQSRPSIYIAILNQHTTQLYKQTYSKTKENETNPPKIFKKVSKWKNQRRKQNVNRNKVTINQPAMVFFNHDGCNFCILSSF